jgi:hypothetical protein
MSEDRTEKLRKAREIPQVELQKYHLLRSKNGTKLICAFEGHDDVTFYDTIFNNINPNIKYAPFVCNGKDKVLALRDILARNVASDAALVRFLVDADFDGLKGKLPGSDIYLTPCYSIENLLVGRPILEKLLRGEFRCHDEHGDADIENIGNLFELRLTEFNACMREANQLLFFARTTDIKLAPIDDKLTAKYLSMSLKPITVVGSHAQLCTLLGYENPPDASALSVCKQAFDLLDPSMDWRGKFLFAFFRKFLSHIKDDRGTKTPVHFKKKGNMTFSPENDIIRTLTTLIAVPECLRAFVSNFPKMRAT